MTARLAALLGLLFLACSNGSSRDAAPFSEHRPTRQVTAATQHLGEDCATTGYQACLSQLCGHFGAAPEAGYFCTRNCSSSLDCPRAWNCAQAYPAPDGMLCIPPSSWDAGVAVVRDGGVE